MKATWKDWFASRMQRLNMFIVAAFSAALIYVTSLSESDLANIGLTEKQIIIAMMIIKIVSALENIRLRADTTGPLAGRAKAK